MSNVLKTKFTELIQNGKGAKDIEYYCPYCEVHHVALRRDMTYVLCTFLLSLREMTAKDGKEFHNYRHVIMWAKKYHNCVPSDYPILHRWNLIKSMEGKNNSKNKALTTYGHEFLDGKRSVKAHHYKIPNTETLLFCKDTITFTELQFQFLHEKEKKNPFFDVKGETI